MFDIRYMKQNEYLKVLQTNHSDFKEERGWYN